MKKTILSTICVIFCVMFAVSALELGWTIYRCVSFEPVGGPSVSTVHTVQAGIPPALTFKGSVYRAFSSKPSSAKKPRLLTYKPENILGAARNSKNKPFHVYRIHNVSPQTAVVYQGNQNTTHFYINEEYLWPYQQGNILFFAITSALFGLGLLTFAILSGREPRQLSPSHDPK